MTKKSIISEFIYYNKNQNHNELKSKLIPAILDKISEQNLNDNTEFCNNYKNTKCITSYYFDDNNLDSKCDYQLNYLFNYIKKDLILPNVYEMIKECSINAPKDIKISNIWFNFYDPGGFHKLHTHAQATFSGIYLLDLGETKNNTIFYSSNSYSYLTNHEITTEDLDEGNIIMFPSNFLHEVPPCLSKKMSLSFNIVFTYK
jgi:hypothetical protein